MSTTPEQPREAEFFSTIRRWGITRGPNGVIGGVIEGLGARVGMARVPARIIVVVAALILTGLVLLAYAAAWGLLPDREGRIIIQDFGRGITNVGALIGIAVLTLLGFGALDGPWMWFPFAGGAGRWNGAPDAVAVVFSIMAALAVPFVIFGIVWLIVQATKDKGDADSTPATPPATPPGSATSAAAAEPGTKAKASKNSPAASKGAVAVSATADDRKDDAARTSTSGVGTQTPPPAAPPAPRTPPPPPRPRVPGPGRAGYLGALAWGFLVTAGVLFAQRTDELAVSGTMAWFTAFTIGLGVIVMLIGLAGRRMGFLGFVATFLAAILLLTVATTDDMRETFRADRAWFDVQVDDHGDVEGLRFLDEQVAFGVAEYFPEYDTVEHYGVCAERDVEDIGGDTERSITLTEPLQGNSINVDEETLTLVPEGRSFTIASRAPTDVQLVFEDQGLHCASFTVDGTLFSATTNGEPTTHLYINDDDKTTTRIYIKETA